MSTYQGEERRDQSEMGKGIRRLIDEIEVHNVIPREYFAVLASYLARAWRIAFEYGRAEGMRNAMDAVERELGALRAWLKED